MRKESDDVNFDYSEEQQLLANSIKQFIAKDYTFEARKAILASASGYSDQVWSTFAEMGLLACRSPMSMAASAAMRSM